jgi:nucleoside-diphosphate-sugar epimerase
MPRINVAMFGMQLQLVAPNVSWKMVENTPDDPRKRKPDITKAKTILGWEPKVLLLYFYLIVYTLFIWLFAFF